jgi:SAM-dependent methyltransferase
VQGLDPGDAPALYDEMGERFERHARDSLWNARYDRPAVLSLVGDVDGKAVLDAGCGPGLYAEELARRGARVVAVDASAEMVRLASARVGAVTEVRRHVLGEPLTFLADGAVDAVVCALVWHYLDDRGAVLDELHRVLRPGGHLVISTVHPTEDWRVHGGDYFDVAVKREHWSSMDLTVPSWRMPLTVLCDEFADHGFLIERILEPRPLPDAAEVDPDEYGRLMTTPVFICFRLLRR